MIITIDGPAGSGKSTVARKLAARLGVAYLDTGAMYRAIAWAAIDRGVDLRSSEDVAELARTLDMDLDFGPTHTRVKIGDRDVSEVIRSMSVSEASSEVAKNTQARSALVERQREIGGKLSSFVAEGRDQGSVVFPDADAKIVLEASAETRAERRRLQMAADGEDVNLQDVLDSIVARDKVDSKQWAPLLVPGAAWVIDTSEMSLPEVLDAMEKLVREQVAGGGTAR